jgi:hypothetical protein
VKTRLTTRLVTTEQARGGGLQWGRLGLGLGLAKLSPTCWEVREPLMPISSQLPGAVLIFIPGMELSCHKVDISPPVRASWRKNFKTAVFTSCFQQ